MYMETLMRHPVLDLSYTSYNRLTRIYIEHKNFASTFVNLIV